ncbi:hypothetical protein [Escherichia phage vB_EcoM_ULIM3]|uniref:Uncharacterized protein n=27 Tax=Felixounavirus TaxID=1198140 RepID=Q6KGM4_BPFO1|nr:hypothetical protein ACQ43_gp043 [Escherichia phage vB_EcoM-VpaE1]YP_009288225.1 hypothetical protein BIZ90_gp041 [Escherichia phage vB_EcoM_Alf5]AAQ14646.1 unknown [Salmonella phage FelixO1]AXH65208.1 hypothetical protein vBEcoMRo111lw_00017 [Escherichia phage vB_EcoM-Ro111lw]QPI14090.1 hypothetical protein GECvBB1_gp049c [Salmonella phage GEC_vB_B1]QPI14238.1 hypothetical protein GECvBBS_gp049c [Salmonella phage GEC_vB_BS]QPI15684.1 hypothetical protein GECvBNS7_gp049c [Salmonella phage 
MFYKGDLMRKSNKPKKGKNTNHCKESKRVELIYYSSSEIGLYLFFQNYRRQEDYLCVVPN